MQRSRSSFLSESVAIPDTVLDELKVSRRSQRESRFAIVSVDSDVVVPKMGLGELTVLEHCADRLQIRRTQFLARMSRNGTVQLHGYTNAYTQRMSESLRGLQYVRDSALMHFPSRTTYAGRFAVFIAREPSTRSECIEALKTEVCGILKEKHGMSIQPDEICIVDKLPYTKAGKLDTRRLRSAFAAKSENVRADHTANWSSTAIAVRNAFHEVSGAPIEGIDLDTTIFRLGLDSINAIQVATVLRKTWPLVTGADVLRNPTCVSLARMLDESIAEGEDTQPLKPGFEFTSFDTTFRAGTCKRLHLTETSVANILPCTPMQGGILSEFLHSSTGFYCNHIKLKLLSGIQHHDIEAAFGRTGKAHQMLRTGFVQIEDPNHPFAMLCYTENFAMTDHLQHDVKDARQWRLDATASIRNELHKPAWRLLLNEANDGIYLDFVILHALYDAHSLAMILEDFSNSIQGSTIEAETDVEMVLSEILLSSSSDVKAQQSFWSDQLKSASILAFPDLNSLQQTESSFRCVARKCCKGAAILREACKTSDVTIQAAAQASWARLLSAYVGEDQVTFGVVFSGRSSTEAESACFPCITTLPYSCPSSTQNRAMLQHAMDYSGSVRKFQFTPLANIQKWTGHSREALFDTIFAYQKTTVTHKNHSWEVVEENSPTNVRHLASSKVCR